MRRFEQLKDQYKAELLKRDQEIEQMKTRCLSFFSFLGGRGGGGVRVGKRKLQRAKKVMSDSPGLVDFAIGLVNSVFNLPNGQVMFFEQFE